MKSQSIAPATQSPESLFQSFGGSMAYPTVYPTGTTIYEPDRCWNGYTVFQAKETGACLIDMNGRVVNLWNGLHGFPNTILPGGYVMGSTGERPIEFAYQDQRDLVQADWD